MGAWVVRIKSNHSVAHLLRAVDRFNSRLGSQFAAAITYFSVLAMVPVLMFAFSILGMTLTVFYPGLLTQATDVISEQLKSAEGAEQIMGVVTNALRNWAAIGVTALVAAAYAGANWIANLRRAVNAMWRKVFDVAPPGGGPLAIVVETLKNLATLLGLMVLGGLTIGASSIATTVRDLALKALGLTDSPVASGLVTAGSVAISLITGWLLFVFLYTVLPEEKMPFKAVAKGAIFGAVGLAVLVNLGGVIGSELFGGNASIKLFGPVILIMLLLNLFAMVAMLGAAWTATASPTATERPYAVDPGEPDLKLDHPILQEPVMVPQPIARRGVQVGLGIGYGVGAATGLGLGALVGRVAGAVANRRSRRRNR